MLTPCKKLYYAVEAVLYIAYHSKERPISSRDIAREQNLPPRHLEQIMQKLVHGGVLVGLRGPKGGYQLAKTPQQITLGHICSVLQEEDVINELPSTTHLGDSIIRPLWQMLFSNLLADLNEISIANLLHKTQRPVQLERALEPTP